MPQERQPAQPLSSTWLIKGGHVVRRRCLIPLGVGLDYAVTERLALTADFLPTFTSLGETVRANGQNFDLHTNVMSDHLTSYSEKRSMRQSRSRKRCTIFLRPAVASRR